MTQPRVRLWLRVVFILLLPIAAYNLWDYIEGRRLESRLEAIQLRKEPTTHFYEVPKGDALRAQGLYRAAAALALYPEGMSMEAQNQVRKAWLEGRWAKEEKALEVAAIEVAENREALEFADRAAAMGFVNFQGGTSYNLQLGELIRLTRLCELRAAVFASQRKGDAALASFVTEVRLTRVLEAASNGSLGLLAPAFRGLGSAIAKAPPSNAARESAATAFAEIDRDDRLRASLIAYRTALLERPRRVTFGDTFWSSFRPLVTHVVVTSLDDFDRLLAASEQPWPQRIEAIIAVGVWPAWPFAPVLRVRQATFLDEFAKRTAEQVQRIRCARLALSTTPLDLIDPLTGKRLEMLNCHL